MLSWPVGSELVEKNAVEPAPFCVMPFDSRGALPISVLPKKKLTCPLGEFPSPAEVTAAVKLMLLPATALTGAIEIMVEVVALVMLKFTEEEELGLKLLSPGYCA